MAENEEGAPAAAEEAQPEKTPPEPEKVTESQSETKSDQTDAPKAAPESEKEAAPRKSKSEVRMDDRVSEAEDKKDRDKSADEAMKPSESVEGKGGDDDLAGRRKSRHGSKPTRASLYRSVDDKKISKSAMSLGERRVDSGIRTGVEETRKSRIIRNALGSIIDIRRSSAAGEVSDRKVARYMNTYKLESENPFNPEKVDKILESVMMEALENLTYDLEKCPKQAKWASMAIKSRVKALDFDRYKIISVVTIGEKHSQDVYVTCRFLWDAEKDRYSTFAMENTYVYGIAQCFGLYYE